MALATPVSLFAQNPAPLQAPATAAHPGVYQSLEQLLEFDLRRFNAKRELVGNRQITGRDLDGVEKVDLDPDFLNDVIVNTPSAYMHLASQNRCAFFDALLTDLLSTRDGKIDQLIVQYKSKKGDAVTGVISKREFIDKFVYAACPQTKDMVSLFQFKSIDAAAKATSFEIPSSRGSCEGVYGVWSTDRKTPYWCQVHELLLEVQGLERDPVKSKDPANQNKFAMAKYLRSKLGPEKIDYVHNFCENADSADAFCSNIFSSSFYSRVVEKARPDVYIKDVCQEYLGKQDWGPLVVRECAVAFRSNTDACLWGNIDRSGLSPRPNCDQLSTALNFSSLWAEYDDCPRHSDSSAVTNVGRVLQHLSPSPRTDYTPQCSGISARTVLDFNRKFDNESMWTAGVCYFDKIDEKEKCLPAFFSEFGNDPGNITRVIAEVLARTKGADPKGKCSMIPESTYNPNLLEFKYGCFVVYNTDNCGLAQCEHRVIYNNAEVKGIKYKSQLAFDYFPNSLNSEKYSQTYVMQRDAQHKTRAIQTLPLLATFFRENPKGIVHGLACAEDLLPGFFKKYAMNQCTPMPFIVDGLIQQGDRAALVTRSAADNVHAPRLLSWGQVFTAVRSYQANHPLKQWTMHALY